MKNLEKELEEFKKFKKDFKYEVKEVEEKDGVEVYEGESLIDENGKEIRHTCNPSCLSNYFGANPTAPHYLTPVYFDAVGFAPK